MCTEKRNRTRPGTHQQHNLILFHIFKFKLLNTIKPPLISLLSPKEALRLSYSLTPQQLHSQPAGAAAGGTGPAGARQHSAAPAATGHPTPATRDLQTSWALFQACGARESKLLHLALPRNFKDTNKPQFTGFLLLSV